MITLANVIFPAFYFPYVATLSYPICGAAALTIEIVTFRIFYRTQSLRWIIGIVLLSNVISSVVGIGLASILPSGLNPAFVQGGHGPAQGPHWNAFATVSWPLLCLLSIAVEYATIRVLGRRRVLPNLGRATAIANVSSYILLFALFQLSVYLTWL